jgi:hypothetical protein
MCNMNTGPTNVSKGAVKSLQEEMREDEDKVYEAIKANDGRLNLDALEQLSGVPWRGGRLSNALYGLDQVQGRIKQDDRDLFSTTFSII